MTHYSSLDIEESLKIIQDLQTTIKSRLYDALCEFYKTHSASMKSM